MRASQRGARSERSVCFLFGEPPGEPAVNVLFLVMCFVSFLGRRQKLAIWIPTVVERLQLGKKAHRSS